MGEVQQVRLQVMVEGDKEANLPVQCNNRTDRGDQPAGNRSSNYWRWIRISMYTLFVLVCQSTTTLLGRQYYDKGGNSKWMQAFVQNGSFFILLPCYFGIPSKIKKPNIQIVQRNPRSLLGVASVYVSLGVIIAAYCFFFSIGLLYLPVSTYALICASQLVFNSLFSYLLNKQKFTPYIINSIVLLTISSILLVFQNDSEKTTGVSKQKYAIGFICTVGASAGVALQYALMQFGFRKFVKRETFTAVLDMVIYPYFVASCVLLVGLFASGEWMGLKREMEEYELGKVSYIMTLGWTGISVQIFSVGSIGLIFETSSLFSNAISALGFPIVPFLAMGFFHEKMQGLKVIAMLLAIWGFVSYVYQNYLDDCESKKKSDNEEAKEVSQASSNGS